MKDDTTLSQAVHEESLDTELVPEDLAMAVELKPEALHMDTSIPVVLTPAIIVATQAPEGQEDRIDSTVIPEAESDLPSYEIKTEGSSSVEEGYADQDSSLSEVGEESHRLTEVEPQIIPTIMEEPPAQIEEDRPDVAALQVRQLPPSSLPTDRRSI